MTSGADYQQTLMTTFYHSIDTGRPIVPAITFPTPPPCTKKEQALLDKIATLEKDLGTKVGKIIMLEYEKQQALQEMNSKHEQIINELQAKHQVQLDNKQGVDASRISWEQQERNRKLNWQLKEMQFKEKENFLERKMEACEKNQKSLVEREQILRANEAAYEKNQKSLLEREHNVRTREIFGERVLKSEEKLKCDELLMQRRKLDLDKREVFCALKEQRLDSFEKLCNAREQHLNAREKSLDLKEQQLKNKEDSSNKKRKAPVSNENKPKKKANIPGLFCTTELRFELACKQANDQFRRFELGVCGSFALISALRSNKNFYKDEIGFKTEFPKVDTASAANRAFLQMLRYYHTDKQDSECGDYWYKFAEHMTKCINRARELSYKPSPLFESYVW